MVTLLCYLMEKANEVKQVKQLAVFREEPEDDLGPWAPQPLPLPHRGSVQLQ